ncbi:MAG TPA: hypothetical protein VHQ66_08360, partial [Myxococcota bacterium]|nr:hypothetical protein [Myxococcota bacterium]
MVDPGTTGAPIDPGPAQAAAELCGWLEAGARAAALLAPAGPARTSALDAAAAALSRRFAVTRLSAKPGESAESLVVRADAAARRALGRAALLVVEDGERLAAAEARALRALADHHRGDLRLAVGLAPGARAAEVLRALGPGLERVALAPPPGSRATPPVLRRRAGAIALAAGSIAAALALLVPRFGVGPDQAPAPAVSSAPSAAGGSQPVREASAPAPVLTPSAAPSPRPAPAPLSAPSAAVEPPVAAAGTPPTRPTTAQPATPAPNAPRAAPAQLPKPAPARPARPVAQAAPVRPAGGYLFVNAIPRARITIDGVPAGPTPLVRHPLARGRHRIVAEFADGRVEERIIEAVGAETYL